MNNLNKFKEFYQNRKICLTKMLDDFNQSLSSDNTIINNNLNYFKILNSDGKLIRGMLVNLGYSLLKDDLEKSDYLALSYEVFQTSILIHDDIIDKDSKRRGKETIHYINYQKYKDYSKNSSEVKHLGNSIALCMGDYGLYLANKIISKNYESSPYLGKILNHFNDTVLKTIEGEILDVVLPFESKYGVLETKDIEDTILNIYKLKTAYYTIIGPLVSGLILAGATSKNLEDIYSFGENIGIAFQLQDDILGIYQEDTNKVLASDIKEYKQTLLYAYTLNSPFKDELEKYYGKDNLNREDIRKVQEIFINSNAKAYVEGLSNSLYEKSLSTLNDISWISADKKEILIGLVEYLKLRNK